MKASEVLAQYTAGNRNFQGVNLRGQSFKGQNLAGADFSQADLRSTNFTGAILMGANFTGAKCGLQKRWAVLLTLLSWLLATISGYLTLLAGAFISLIFDTSNLDNRIIGWVSLISLVIFVVVTLRRGIVAGVAAAAKASPIAAALAAPIAAAAKASAAVTLAAPVVAAAVAGGGAAAAAATVVAGVKAAALAPIAALALIGIAALSAVLSAALATTGVLIIGAAAAGALVGAAVALIGTYISWRTMKGDPRDAWIRSFAVAFAALRGTSFRGADLTDANFSFAKLKSTDLRRATLTRVRWYGADMLDRSRPGNTYLQSSQVRQWLIGKGTDKNFDGQQLQGVNFQGADLTDASFINANLNEANLRDADLSRAKLIQTQLDKTDFTGATLTGACIEDWGITTHTKLDDVKCKYIFMRSPTPENENRRRKPDNWEEEFTGNDFADFIKPIQDTLDLYHNQGVDPRAIAIAWKKLIENNPDAQLEFNSLEVKGKGNLLLRFITAMGADLSQLNKEYFTLYNRLKGLTEAEVESQVEDKQTRDRENFLRQALPPIKTIKIFLASSSELASDRREFEIFINRKNKEYIKQNIFLELVLGEDFIDAMSATRLQDEYNKAVQDCDIFVSLFHTKVGKYTEEEFLKALETFKVKKKPLIYTYFKDEAVSVSRITFNIVSLLNFKQKLSDLGHFYTNYADINDLKYKFSEQLAKTVSNEQLTTNN